MLSRRKFIYSTGILGASVLAYPVLKLWKNSNDLNSPMMLPDEWIWVGKNKGGTSFAPRGAVVGVNSLTLENRSISVAFLPHDIAINPVTPYVAVTTMKWGTPGIVADLYSQKVLYKLLAPVNTQFFGHTAWSDDGAQFYCVAQNEKTKKGEILIYSLNEFSLKGRIELTGSKPHQMRKTGIPGEVIIINKESPLGTTRLDFVDMIRGKVTKSWDLPAQSYYHFAYSTAQKRIWAGGYVGQISFLGQSLFATIADNKVTEIDIPKVDSEIVRGENLSLNLGKLNGTEVLAFTVAGGKSFALYDTQKNKYIQVSNEFVAPMGIDFSKQNPNILYVSDASNSLHLYDIRQGQFQLLKTLPFGGGSHLTVA